MASALLACISGARAADVNDTGALVEVVVTAQKRAENLQDVPLSIQAFGTAQLEELGINSFDDYAKYLPSVSFQKVGNPSVEHTYFRGVSSGGDGNHSGSQPSVGMYLDEQPVTTIDGNLNIHIYDIERVEALAGPQGTLYGASSQSGTIRIITNKPDPSGFKAGYDVGVNQVAHGGVGYSVEAFVNLPLTDIAAVRLVGWDVHDAGYIDNVHGAVTFPTSGIVFDNAPFVKKDYNTVETKGGRAALKVNINDNWTILPTVMGQVQQTDGDFAYNPALGDLEVQHWFPQNIHDSWVQSALTVEGKIGNFDLVYAGAYLTRNTHEQSDYTDYSLYYDSAYGKYFVDNAGALINPAQTIIGRDHYTKYSHELRFSTPKDAPVRFVGGLFLERQVHEILQDYVVDNGDPLGSVAPNDVSVPGWPGTLWLTDQERVDRDRAIFGELTWDITEQLSVSAGLRHFTYDNSLQGFYGFSSNFSSHTGVAICFLPLEPFHGAPCSDLDRGTSGSGNSPKVNLTYKIDHDHMIYATYSKGFRPGGVNRNGGGTLPPYQPDYLKNYEFGWKTTWLDNRLRFNGAFFREDWSNFQFSYLGPNSLTIITNAGQARIDGLESDLEFAATQNLLLSGGFSLLDAKLTQTFCGDPTICNAPDFDSSTYEQYAASGTRLPVTPKFKGNVTGRYSFPVGSFKGDVQASAVYVGKRTSDLRTLPANTLGDMPSYTVVDLSAGMEIRNFHYQVYLDNAFDKRAVLNKYAECDVLLCGAISTYIVPNQPRTIGVKFGQKF
ncbi:MAG TPA: TonB-dependent receptor [Steroidobacteraceae bacterium]|nr:TonB-dependent receptor [Steroidobacteraceae bacterium]